MDCPTCFRKMVVPQAPSGPDSKLILQAAQATSRPATKSPDNAESPRRHRSPNRARMVVLLAVILVAGAAVGALVTFRDIIFKRTGAAVTTATNAPPVCGEVETNWTLKLAGRRLSENPAAGRIKGREFTLDRAVVQGGVLSFRQGAKTPQEIIVAVQLFARRGEDLAAQNINIEASRTNAPKVGLRWKDDQNQPVTDSLHEGYALRIEFGQVTAGHLPGRIYLCLPDAEKSWLAGAFVAEIRKPAAPKPPKTPQPTPKP